LLSPLTFIGLSEQIIVSQMPADRFDCLAAGRTSMVAWASLDRPDGERWQQRKRDRLGERFVQHLHRPFAAIRGRENDRLTGVAPIVKPAEQAGGPLVKLDRRSCPLAPIRSRSLDCVYPCHLARRISSARAPVSQRNQSTGRRARIVAASGAWLAARRLTARLIARKSIGVMSRSYMPP
jgi:hypothetical protein